MILWELNTQRDDDGQINFRFLDGYIGSRETTGRYRIAKISFKWWVRYFNKDGHFEEDVCQTYRLFTAIQRAENHWVDRENQKKNITSEMVEEAKKIIKLWEEENKP